jgi:DNA repair exonuclease SbcCD ATPase subunit
MTVEQIVDAAVNAGPGSLSKEGLAFRESQVREAEAALQAAKRSAASADAKVNSLAKKQALVNDRLVEVNAALRDKAGLRAILADLKTVKKEGERRAGLEQEKRLLTEALQLLVSCDFAEAEIASKEARLTIKRTQRDWCVCKATEEAATLWAALAPAMRRDPNLTIQLDNGGVIVEYVKKIAEIDRDIDELGAALARETQAASRVA